MWWCVKVLTSEAYDCKRGWRGRTPHYRAQDSTLKIFVCLLCIFSKRRKNNVYGASIRLTLKLSIVSPLTAKLHDAMSLYVMDKFQQINGYATTDSLRFEFEDVLFMGGGAFFDRLCPYWQPTVVNGKYFSSSSWTVILDHPQRFLMV